MLTLLGSEHKQVCSTRKIFCIDGQGMCAGIHRSIAKHLRYFVSLHIDKVEGDARTAGESKTDRGGSVEGIGKDLRDFNGTDKAILDDDDRREFSRPVTIELTKPISSHCSVSSDCRITKPRMLCPVSALQCRSTLSPFMDAWNAMDSFGSDPPPKLLRSCSAVLPEIVCGVSADAEG